MKKRMIKKIALGTIVLCLTSVAIIGTVFANLYWDYLMGTFGKSNSNLSTEKTDIALALGDNLAQEIVEESAVLLKNEDNILPLKEDNRKINLFGYGSSRQGYVYSGGGSSGTTINMDRPGDPEIVENALISPIEAFEMEGFEVNKKLEEFYNNFSDYNATIERGINTLYNPKVTSYTRDLMVDAINFSDTAAIFISRNGSESTEIPLIQYKNNGKGVQDTSRSYLELTTEEEDLIELVTDNFENVVVFLNTASPIEVGFLDDKGIDAAFYTGITGQSGTLALPRLLKGYKEVEDNDGNKVKQEVTPSGRLSDTYAYSLRKYNPTNANMFPTQGTFGEIVYNEGIYVGYKWYETADVEGYFENIDNEYGKGYEGVVQYPFGYGLSYEGTDFEYSIETSLDSGSKILENTEIEISITVKNSLKATRSGKETIELYFVPPYYKGEIEKSAVNLLAFNKTTQNLGPGQSQTFNFKVTPYDLAVYDEYGRNPGDHKGYELDRGEYTISLRKDAHSIIECENNNLKYVVDETINIDKDPVTQNKIENRFTGENAYLGLPIDGSTVGSKINYLSRADFEGTFPTKRTEKRTDVATIDRVNTARNTAYDTNEMPITEQNNGLYLVTKDDGSKASAADLSGSTGAKLKFNEELVSKLGKNYDDTDWDKLLNQMSIADMNNLISNGFFGTRAIESVGKPLRLDIDGPAGFHYTSATDELKEKFVAYPSESLIGCCWSPKIAYSMGQAQGVIANATNVNGWYGPGLNLHRNPFSGRFFEYYSEDSILTGIIAGEVVRGATNNGLYCYMKHFAVSEEGINPDNVKTYLTEQTVRETYLKPFEIATKKGGANAIMTSFNCIGAVWAGACDPMNNAILRGEWGFRGSLITDWALGNRDFMNGMQGIRGGNDLMLDLNEPFESNNPTSVNLARTASKNILYTFANTYARAKEYQENGGGDDEYKVDLDIEIPEAPFSLIPILMVTGVWVLTSIASGVCIFYMFKKPKKNK